MSDDIMHQQLARTHRRLGQTEVVERSALYLPFAQRVLNPFPLASSGASWGECGQPWAVVVLALTASVFVSTTNNGTNYWTITIISTALTVATLDTSAIGAGAWTRLSTTTITQPAASNVVMSLVLTATGAPGAIVLAPALAALRSGS